MSRLCRLKNKSHGEDGKWAYDEIVTLRKQRDELLSALEGLTGDIQALIGESCGVSGLHMNGTLRLGTNLKAAAGSSVLRIYLVLTPQSPA